jgi:hypothetical protein
MIYTAAITDPHDPDAMPMWESFDHPNVQDALQASRAYIHATRPGDHITDDGEGTYAIWTGPAPSNTRVATLVIAPTDEHHGQPPTTASHFATRGDHDESTRP